MKDAVIKYISDNIIQFALTGAGVGAMYYIRKVAHDIVSGRKKHPLKTEDLTLYGRISAVLGEVLSKSNAARVFILSIRNGDVQLNSLHQHKIYCDFEECQNGVSQIKPYAQGMHVQDILNVVSAFYYPNTQTHGITRIANKCEGCSEVILKLVWDDVPSRMAQEVARDSGAKMSYYAVITDKDNKYPIGALCIDYCSEKHVIEAEANEDEIHEVLCEGVRDIQVLLHRHVK